MVFISNKGPCQFPTLGFVVDRFNRAKDFVEEPFWKLEVYVTHEITTNFIWARGHLFDQDVVQMFYEKCYGQLAKVDKITAKPKSKW
jgi:DNA topoisomerase-3